MSNSSSSRRRRLQYSYAFLQVLDDHDTLGSIGSVGDAFDNPGRWREARRLQ